MKTTLGTYGFIKNIYNKLFRRYLPKKVARYSGVQSRHRAKLLDISADVPEHKRELIAQLSSAVRYGDRVTSIGASIGASAVHAVWSGADSVHVFEASKQNVHDVREAAKLNKVSNRLTITHALVGPAKDVYGDFEDAERISGSDLPECDVLELDCEGAELEILNTLEIAPREIVVESHPKQGATTNDIRNTLCSRGYQVVSSVQDPTDGDVLHAVQKDQRY